MKKKIKMLKFPKIKKISNNFKNYMKRKYVSIYQMSFGTKTIIQFNYLLKKGFDERKIPSKAKHVQMNQDLVKYYKT